MMYGELYQYFILYKQLNVPGIGTFQLERIPATADFPNKVINAPSFSIALQHDNATPSKRFFNWLAHALQVSDQDAVVRFNDFAFDIKQKIRNGDKITWEGVGTLSSGLAGEIRFEPAMKNKTLEAPVKAEKIIREKSEHMVRVGEDERTSDEMIEFLNQPAARRNYWWAWALIAGLIITMFIGWYFSENGLQVMSSGNNHKPKSVEATSTYQQLR
jgi:hypothetical protein